MTRENCKIMKQFRDTDYFVTEDGRVIGKRFNKPMKPNIHSRGYYQVNLYFNKKRTTFRINRMVAEVYLPNPNNLPMVEHIDDNKLNNHVSNLEWVTDRENKDRAIQNGLYLNGIKNHKSKLTEEQVKWIRDYYIPRHKEFGCRPLSRKLNVSQVCISNIINNKTWSHI